MEAKRKLLYECILDSREDMQSLSLAVGKNRTYLQQYIKRGMPKYLPVDVAGFLSKKFGINWEDYVKPSIKGFSSSPQPNFSACIIEEVDGKMVACDKKTDQELSVVAEWTLPKLIANSLAEGHTEKLKIVQVNGDSMLPVLCPGDRVAVDTDQIKPTPPGIFAIWDGLGVLIKRLEYMPETKTVRVSSANESYATYDQELGDLNIQGRVVWAGRQI